VINEANRKWLEGELGLLFRNLYIKGIARLHRRSELKLSHPKLVHLVDPTRFAAHLKSIAPRGLHVFVQPPPDSSPNPDRVLRYLARYINGGPISNSRIVSHESNSTDDGSGFVTFKARSYRTSTLSRSTSSATATSQKADADAGSISHAGNSPVGDAASVGVPSSSLTARHASTPAMDEIKISGIEFVGLWCIHLLPKSFSRIRHYGGLSNGQRKKYLAECRQVLDLTPTVGDAATATDAASVLVEPTVGDAASVELITVGDAASVVETIMGDAASVLVATGDTSTAAQLIAAAAATLLIATSIASDSPDIDPQTGIPKYYCHSCDAAMRCIDRTRRRSWNEIFNSLHRPAWYSRPPRTKAAARAPPVLVKVTT